MNFSFNSKDIVKSTSTSTAKLPVGIHPNCLLKTFEKGETPNGNQYIEFIWENEKLGASLNKRVWYPNMNNPMPRDGESDEQAVQRQINDAAGIFLHILETYMTSDEAAFNATSFEELIDVVIRKLTKKKADTVPVFLKVILDNKGYSAIPRFPRWTEKQVTDSTTLKFTKWEQENAMKPKESESDSPFLNSSSNGGDDVPF